MSSGAELVWGLPKKPDEFVLELQWSNAQDVEIAVEAAGRGLKAWNALSKVSQPAMECGNQKM